ncbi:MAG: HEAT repeat domain-containing protein, partial [Ginsengibacter sp.]
EDVTGKDMNWFWNQWYYGSGQPSLDINYDYQNGTERVIVNQTQNTGKIFKLPVAIDVYSKDTHKTRYKVWLENPSDTFYFASAQKPSLVNVDADKVLLAIKNDNKSADEFEQQYKYAPNYLDRREALEYFAKNNSSNLSLGLNDKYYGLRLLTLESLDTSSGGYSDATVLKKIEDMATKDPNKKVQAKAIEILAKLEDKKYEPIFQKYIADSSYSVAGAALKGLAALEPSQSYALAKKYSVDALGDLGTVVAAIIMSDGTESDFDFLLSQFKKEPVGQDKVISGFKFANYLLKVNNPQKVKEGVDEIMKFRNQIPQKYWSYFDPGFKRAFDNISAAQKSKGNTELSNYIDNLLK